VVRLHIHVSVGLDGIYYTGCIGKIYVFSPIIINSPRRIRRRRCLGANLTARLIAESLDTKN